MGKYWGNNIKNTIKTILPNPGQTLFNQPPPKDQNNLAIDSQTLAKSITDDDF
jgi:hypothetical protein